MRKLLIVPAFLLALPAIAHVQGEVVVGERKCRKRDYVVIETLSGYVYAQVYTGSFDKGDLVVGAIDSYGLKNVKVNGSTGSVYIDDFMLSRSRAAEKCFGER